MNYICIACRGREQPRKLAAARHVSPWLGTRAPRWGRHFKKQMPKHHRVLGVPLGPSFGSWWHPEDGHGKFFYDRPGQRHLEEG